MILFYLTSVDPANAAIFSKRDLGGTWWNKVHECFRDFCLDARCLSRLETESFLKMKTDEDETGGFKSGKDPQGENIKRFFQRVERVKHHCDNR